MSRWVLALLALLAAGQASAQCAVVLGIPPVSFGSVSSTDVRTTQQSTTVPNAGLQCSGSLLSLLRTDDFFKATFTSTGGTTTT